MKKADKQPNTKAVENGTEKPKKKGKKTKPIEMHSDLKNMTKPQEYLEYVMFMALPRTMRVEVLGIDDDTQESFGKKYGVNKNTLTDWKNRAGFWDDVMTVRKEFFRARTADVILALETKSLDPNKVQGQDVRILLTYTGEYSEKVENEHKITPELQTALDKIGKVLS